MKEIKNYVILLTKTGLSLFKDGDLSVEITEALDYLCCLHLL